MRCGAGMDLLDSSTTAALRPYGGERLHAVFEREFAHLPEGEREALKTENAKFEVILKPQRFIHQRQIGIAKKGPRSTSVVPNKIVSGNLIAARVPRR